LIKGENMKSYSKGILVGISIVVGSLLLMGLTSSQEVGRYQISITTSSDSNEIYESIIDTKTGEIFKRNRVYWSNFNKIK
tara:strand:- start:63 stop:302 length:240 start_codon:yes stop_codon:yes gene_type:complete